MPEKASGLIIPSSLLPPSRRSRKIRSKSPFRIMSCSESSKSENESTFLSMTSNKSGARINPLRASDQPSEAASSINRIRFPLAFTGVISANRVILFLKRRFSMLPERARTYLRYSIFFTSESRPKPSGHASPAWVSLYMTPAPHRFARL